MPTTSSKTISDLISQIYVKGAPLTTQKNLSTFVSSATVVVNGKKGVQSFWMASSADNARDEHMTYYDDVIDEHTSPLPGEAYGCQCGIYTKEVEPIQESLPTPLPPTSLPDTTPKPPSKSGKISDVTGFKDGFFVNAGYGKILRETEKAVHVGDVYDKGIKTFVRTYGESLETGGGVLAYEGGWLPKSQIIIKDDEVFVANWLLNDKAQGGHYRIGKANYGKRALEEGTVKSKLSIEMPFLQVKDGKIVER